MRIYVSAYLDKNLGDDIMLWLLATHFPEHSFHLYCPNPDYFPILPDCDNLSLTTIPLKGIQKSPKKKFDGYIRIGGSLFEMKGIRTPIYRYLNALRMEKWMRKGFKSAIVGCNISTFPSKMAEFTAKKEFRTFELATVRDQKTFRFAQPLKAPEHLYAYPDMLFSLPSSFFPLERKEDGPLGLSVYRSKYLPTENSAYYKAMAAFCDQYIETTQNAVHFFAFDTGLEDDTLAAEEIRKRMKHAVRTKFFPHQNVGSRLLPEMAKCSVIVCTRFHAIVLAMRMGIPFVPISYSEKTESLLHDIGYKGMKIMFSEIDDTTPVALMDAVTSLDYTVSADLSDLISLGEGHMQKLRDYLDGKLVNIN